MASSMLPPFLSLWCRNPLSTCSTGESQSKPGIKMVHPESCKEFIARIYHYPQLFLDSTVPNLTRIGFDWTAGRDSRETFRRCAPPRSALVDVGRGANKFKTLSSQLVGFQPLNHNIRKNV